MEYDTILTHTYTHTHTVLKLNTDISLSCSPFHFSPRIYTQEVLSVICPRSMLGGDFPSSVRYAYVVETVGEGRGVASEGREIALWRAYFTNRNTWRNEHTE
jgi:hypothetical protein